MSGWIKLEKALRDDPRVLRMASRLRNADVTLGDKARAIVMGALAQLWCYADTHVRQDDTLDLGPDELDDFVGVPGFARLLPLDWLEIIDESTVKLPNFHTHNGTESKKKALNQKRQERHRRDTSVTPALTSALPDQTRPDQTKPDHKNKEGAAPPPPDDLDLPAWNRWVEYRKAIRKPLKPVSIPAAQRELATHAHDQAAVVEQSIANGWQGLFALKAAATKTVTPIRLRSIEELEAEEAKRANG
jgi:hypothetical protein